MSHKTRVLNVRVVGFSAPERQMLNSIFLLSVAPARQIGYKLWNSESGAVPDMYLLDGDNESAVLSWQAAFNDTADRTLVVGARNTDLGVASAARPLGLKVVGAMDRLAIALSNLALGHTVSASVTETAQDTHPRQNASLPPVTSGMTAQQPALSVSLNASLNSMSAISANASTLAAASLATTHTGTLPTTMTASAPAATVLPSVTLQPNVAVLNEKPVAEKAVEQILSEVTPVAEKSTLAANLLSSGVTPLTPAALSAVVAPAARSNLRVVPNFQPMAASLPSASVKQARIADVPMITPFPAPVISITPVTPVAVTPAPLPVIPASMPTAHHEEQVFRVLAVDDSPLMRTFLQNKLAPYGIHPEFAASGEEALFKISKQHTSKQPFDLIFLDVMLPGMDGYDVCKMIKKNKDNSHMKVVMLTSKDRTFDKIRGTMAGCDGYLTKPVDELKLRGIIERHTVARK